MVMAETIAIKQQLIVMNRSRKRSPKLATRDRFLFGLLTILIGQCRLQKIAIMIKSATILAFRKSLVKRKYSLLYSNKKKKVPGRKSQEISLGDDRH